MEGKKLDEEKLLLPSTMQGSKNKPLSVFIKMEDMPKTKDEFRQEGYTLDREKMGICYIINNVDNEQPATRRDVRKAEETWTDLGFDVKLYLNQTKDEMRALRNNEILNDENYKNCNCLVILIIAHGSNKRNIFDVRGGTAWNLDVLEEQIARIKSLEGRPKLLFVEACRGQRQHNVVTPANLKPRTELTQLSTATKDVEDYFTNEIEEEDEDYMKFKHEIELSIKNVGRDNGALAVVEKTKLGGVPAMGTQVSTMENNDEQSMPSKRDQFIGLSTVENYVAFTVNTSGSPYLQHLMKQLYAGAFLNSLQSIHQTTRQEVEKVPIHEHRYMVPDEHNRLHADLCFRNHLIGRKDKSQPLIKGSISHESTIMLLGVTYNILEHCADAHQVFNSGHKIPAPITTQSHLQIPGNSEQSKCFYDLPKGSMVQNSVEPPRAFMEILSTNLEYFSEANKNLINTENKFHLDPLKISEPIVITNPCPGFNIIENNDTDFDKSKHIITFYKEYPMLKVTLGPDNLKMLSEKSIDKKMEQAIGFDCPKGFQTWIEKCPIHISIEEIHRDTSQELDSGTKQKINNFLSHWEHYFGKFGSAQKLKEIVDSFPGIKETFLDGNSRQITKPPSTKYVIDCGDRFVNFECPKEMQNGDIPNYKAVKLEELSREEAEKKKETYKQFLNYWGHHFVSEFYLGGSITLKLLLNNEDLKNAAQIKDYLNEVCSDKDIKRWEPELKVIDVQFKGGDIQYHQKSFDELNTKQMIGWKESLRRRPTPLKARVNIVPMYLAVACLDPERSEIVRQTSKELQQQGKDWTDKLSWNDTEYTGESEDGKPHGRGISKGSHGTYTGGFTKGDRCGHGKCHFTQNKSEFTENLSHYNGEWMDDKPDGKGEGHFRKGDIYIGQWKYGKPEGLGTVYYEDGSEATVLCRDGCVEEIINGAVKDIQIGTKCLPKKSKIREVADKTLDWYNTKKRKEQWLIKVGILLLILLVATGFVCLVKAIAESLRESTCTETMLAKWDTVNTYDYNGAGFLDVSVLRLNNSSRKTCQQSNLVMDLFSVSSKTEEEISSHCMSLDIPKSSYSFDNASNLQVVQHVYGDHIVRFRTCDPKDCKSHNIGCTPVQRYKPLTCLQALANQWDEITQHNSTDITLTVDMNLLSPSNKDMCQLDLVPVKLEMFAVSPDAPASDTDYFSCQSFGSNSPTVLPFGQKMMTLNATGFETIRYVSGSFIFRLSANGNQVCTYPKKIYTSQNDDDIITVWNNDTCGVDPDVKAQTAVKTKDDACIFTISSYPFFDCYLMDKSLTATMKLKLLNETQNDCDSSGTFIEDEAKIIRKSANNNTPILGDVSFSLPMNATFCLEALVNYPLCPSRNKDDESKCSRPAGKLTIIKCEKQW